MKVPKRKRSYVLNPATAAQRSQDRRAELNAYAKSLGHPAYDTWDKLSTAILKGKAKVVLIKDNEKAE